MLWFLRMSKWARHPPSAKRVMLVLSIIATGLVVWAVERWIGWPDALTAERLPRGAILR